LLSPLGVRVSKASIFEFGIAGANELCLTISAERAKKHMRLIYFRAENGNR
jgi:hypothetical protein